MGEKDLTQKELESFPDVFADCVNALLGESAKSICLLTEHLVPAPTETIYSVPGARRKNQFEDVGMYEMDGEEIISLYRIENQTRVDRKMILRKISYEGATYRTQYGGKSVYPIVSMVLYWGRDRWNAPKSLYKLMHEKGRQYSRYVEDARLHVFEMAHLPKEIRQRFGSDMRIVVDYLAEGSAYEPTNQKILHVDALLGMLRALSGDERYEELSRILTREEKEEISMCELLDKYEKRGERRGERRGEQRGKHIKALEIATQLLDVLDIATIAVKTGLTEDEVRHLQISP